MRVAAGLLVAAVSIGGARVARVQAVERHETETGAQRPFVPSPSSARLLSLGYHEALAGILYVRMIGYFVGEDASGDGVADLAEAIVSLDPTFYGAYDRGANAMTLAKTGVGQSVFRRAVALLEAGMKQFPDDWRLPYLASQIYTQDLESDDPAQQRKLDERGALLMESAVRKPGAPANAGTFAAMMRTKLGQHERAIANLKELLLTTNDNKARARLLENLAQLQKRDATAVAAEVFEQRNRFERAWKAQRKTIPASMFILVGPRVGSHNRPGFDMTDLATGGRDLHVDEIEILEPVE